MALSAPTIETLKSINWRKAASYANPQAVKDLDVFLDKLPARAGSNGLIAAGIVWVIAGIALLVCYTNAVNIRELHKQLTQAEALRPSVPTISYLPVPTDILAKHVEKMKNIYKTLAIQNNGNNVSITAQATRDFPAWRAAIGDLAYGDLGWRLKVANMCAGRDCQGMPLQITLTVQQMDINLPQSTE